MICNNDMKSRCRRAIAPATLYNLSVAVGPTESELNAYNSLVEVGVGKEI